MGHTIDLFLGLLVAIAALALLAKRLKVPYPIVFVIGGLVIGILIASNPRLPRIHLEPELVFVLFLPPLLFPSALFTSWRDFRANLRPILLLAVGLVLFTTLAVGFLAHWLVGLPLGAAFSLGAIVSPPDAIAATAIAHRLGVPRRVVTVLEGESLVNDASALVALRFAVAAMATGSFSIAHASISFVFVSIGGILMGLVIGWMAVRVSAWVDDPPVQIVISLLTPFAAYLPAERLGLSGVLAVVTAGIYVGWRTPEITDAKTRLQAYPFWEMVEFLLNGIIFILIGLQLPDALESLRGHSISRLCWQAVLLSLVVIAIRIVWVFASTYASRLVSKRLRQEDPYPNWKNVMIVAWTGMRGVVSLAAALGLPLTMANGETFPGRDLILFFTFCIILATLVFQGLSLPYIIRFLKVRAGDEAEQEERMARLKANEAAMARLRELGKEDSVPNELVDRLHKEYEDRIKELGTSAPGPEERATLQAVSPYIRLQQEALLVERKTILDLRNDRVINDEVMRRIEHDLDLAEARLHLEPQGD